MAPPRRSARALAAGVGLAAVVGLAGPALGATPVRAGGVGSDAPTTRGAAAGRTVASTAGHRTGNGAGNGVRNRAGDSVAAARAPDDAPLQVSIADLSPSYLPTRGDVVVTGTVTNRDDQPWTSIALYAFDGSYADQLPVAPMRNAAQLAKAAATPFDAVVGDRILIADHPTIESLAPGASRTFTVTVPADDFRVSAPGVYWFGIHALGQSATTPMDGVADGRARTFLPYVPQRLLDRRSPLPTALVMPLTRPIDYDDDGTLADLPSWTRTLSTGGRTQDALAFATTSSPVTLLLDPALVDAVGHLAEGNQPRTLDPTDASPSPSTGPGSTTTVDPGVSARTVVPSADTPADTTADTTDDTAAETSEAAAAATTWLAALRSAATDGQVLTLPYGNLDVPAALRHDPSLVGTASQQRSSALTGLGVPTSPAFASPGGYLDADSVAAAPVGTTVLATDRMFAGPVRGLAEVDGHEVVVASSGAEAGGPGPGPARTAIALRQRILSEAAVRLLKPDSSPLTVVLPTDLDAEESGAFFAGLQAPWLHLETVRQLAGSGSGETVEASGLVYPPLQRRRELDGATFVAVEGLMSSGDTLQGVLTDRTDLAGEITRQALTGAGYTSRTSQSLDRARVTQTRAWVQSKLGSIEITAPRGVTLASASGKFAATLTNRLDQPVTVAITAAPDVGLEVDPSRSIQLGPHSHTTVLLRARATTNKVHNVTLVVTDSDGTPIGSTDQLPIRSAQVSNVIWLIMGTGIAILFSAILVRLVRRFRRSRRRPTAAA